jgi:hypothetical protein
MISRSDCAAAEMLAGAIALREASDSERDTYRSHVAVCRECLRDFGGEREIERVMGAVAHAHEQEHWEPDLRGAILRRKPRQAWLWAGALAAVVLAVLAARTAQPSAPLASTPAVSAGEVRALASLGTQAAVPREGRAESLAVGAATYSTAFEISVDQRGIPVRCTITKSSGIHTLDGSVCHAAMQSHYPPHPHQ